MPRADGTDPAEMRPDDLAACREAIRTGSRSFYAASKLLPAHVRDPALALYAFCRLADDAVDLSDAKTAAVLSLRDRLDLAYAGTPREAPADRAFAAMIRRFDMPKALPDALLEGLAWDALDRRYQTFSDLLSYSARVASAVGAMMCVLMRVRGRDALARACDLGAAMQLTNIARDIGEDAAAHRLYLPLDWMRKAGVDPEAFLADPRPTPEIRYMTRRLLLEADRLYKRSTAGIGALPLRSRPGILAARHIYAGIGHAIAMNGFDSVTTRARTTTGQKLGWLALAMGQTGLITVSPRSAVVYARPLREVAFLVDAAATDAAPASAWGDGRAGALVSALATLEQRDRAARGAERFDGPARPAI